MNRNKITHFQYLIMTFFLLNSFIPLIGYQTITKISLTTSLLSIIIGYFLTVFLIFFIKNIQGYKSKLNIIQKIKTLFPKTKNIYITILIITILTALLYSLNNLVTFINYYILKDVSLIVITSTFLLTIFYALTKNIESIFKLAEISFYIYIFIFIISTIGIGKNINLYNIKPLLASPLKNTAISSLIYLLSSVIPLLLLQIIPPTKVTTNKKINKSLIKATQISSLLIFINLFLIITTLGIELTNIYQNPDIIVYKKISLLNVLERLETSIAFNNILNSFFFILLGIYFLKESIIELFNIKKEKETLSLFLIIFSLMIISTILTIPKYIYLLISLIALIIILFINIKILIHKHNLQQLKKM